MCMFKNRERLLQQTWDIWGHKRCFPGAWEAQVHPTQTPHHLWLHIDQGKARHSKCDIAQVLGCTWGLWRPWRAGNSAWVGTGVAHQPEE